MESTNNTTGGTEHKSGLRQAFETIRSQLNLSADQDEKINEIFKNLREERTEIKNSAGNDLKEEMHDARHDAKEQVMALLNDEQKKILQHQLHALRS